jgi:hypothetical protein
MVIVPRCKGLCWRLPMVNPFQPLGGQDGALQGNGNGLPIELSRLAPEDRTREESRFL